MRYYILSLFLFFLGYYHALAQTPKNNALGCTKMQIAVSNTVLKVASNENYYYISYCNLGSIVANNAYIEIDLDPFLTVVNSELAIQNQQNNSYRFDLGNVNSQTCHSFWLQVELDSTTPSHQAHCITASIYPNTFCDSSTNNPQNGRVFSVQWRQQIQGTSNTEPVNSIFEDNVMLDQRPLWIDSLQAIAARQNISMTDIITQFEDYQQQSAMLAASTNNNSPMVLANNCSFNIGRIALATSLLSTNTIIDNSTDFRVYPNPCSDYIIFETYAKTYASFSVQLIDLRGVLVKQLEVKNQQKIIFKNKSLAAGVYFYKLLGDNQQIASGKIIVQ